MLRSVMMTSYWTRTALTAGLLMLLVGAAGAADTPPEKLLPPIVYGFVSVPDVAVLKQRGDASAIGEMLRDPKLAPTRDQFQDLLAPLLKRFRKTWASASKTCWRFPREPSPLPPPRSIRRRRFQRSA